MAQLGPAMTFETVGKILLVGLCGLTNYKRLELLAVYAITTVIVDFLIFMRWEINTLFFHIAALKLFYAVSSLRVCL